jgi:hypothetical protein
MTKHLQEHLLSGDGIAPLIAHADRLLHLQVALETALPAALRPYVRIVNFRRGKACIQASSSAMANKIRQLGPRLADALSSPATQVTEIEVRVQAGAPVDATVSRLSRPALPDKARRQALATLAASLPAESPLKLSLERLLRGMAE